MLPPDCEGLWARLTVRRDGFELDVELRARPTETVALVGPSGAGKSTVLGALAGLVPVDRAEVLVCGKAIESTERRVRLPPQARQVGIMFQGLALFPHLTALQNVAYGPRSRGWKRAAAEKRARQLLEAHGLADHADRRPPELSGGQAQRVALARALATEPDLLLLDEPLSMLDVRTRDESRSALKRSLTGFGGVKVVVTHDPRDALELADRLLVLEDGKLTQAGTARELREQPASDYVRALFDPAAP